MYRYDLAPSTTPKLRSVRNGRQGRSTRTILSKHSDQNVQSYQFDDSPRAFKRLMHLVPPTNGKSISSRNGHLTHNKPKSTRGKDDACDAQLRVRGGEKLSDFGARVDQALPIANLVKKSNKRSKTIHKSHQISANDTMQSVCHVKKDKGMQKEAPNADADCSTTFQLNTSRGANDLVSTVANPGKKKRRQLSDAEIHKNPWSVLEVKRNKPLGLHDIAKSPPELQTLRRASKKNNLGAVGCRTNISLKRREDLEKAREAVIKDYRRRMAEKRNCLVHT